MRLIVVDDHPLFREGIVQVLRTEWPQAEVLCADNALAGATMASRGADLVLLDLDLPGVGGAEAVGALCRASPGIPVAVLTASDDRRDIEAAMRLGARCFINKATPPEELLAIVSRVLAGEVVAPSRPEIAAGVSRELTPRQREILSLICQGQPNKEIALRLTLSETTVKTHVTAIFHALGVVNRPQAVLAARRYGLATTPSADG